MYKIISNYRQYRALLITALFVLGFLCISSIAFVYASGNPTGGSGGGSSMSGFQSCGSNCTQYNQGGQTYQTRSSDFNGDGDIRDPNEVRTSCTTCGGSSHGGSSGGSTNPPSTNCSTRPNLRTVDIFFVPLGTEPAVQKPIGNRPFFGANIFPLSNPYKKSMIAGNQLEVGLSYEPVAMIRNIALCTTHGGSDSDGDNPVEYHEVDIKPLSWQLIPTAYAGGGGSSQPNDYPNYFRTQLPFGSNGSFPVRVRIDVGNNTTYEWEQYINAVGPTANGQTIYLKFPAFIVTEIGSHRIEVVTDIRHSVDPGRTCYATTTPASAGWGCVRETNERDNDRSEAFTTGVGSTSLQIAVDVSDMIKRANTEVTEVPFTTTNNGRATISNYRYRVTIGSTLFSSSTQTTSLLPTSQETVRSTGTYTTPNLDTTLPLTVCARVATTTEVCDTARLIVGVPQCSDSRDNDGDGVQDSSDPSCFGDPLDPDTYDPDDNNEGDLASTSASVTIEFKPVTNPVRYDTSATLAYIINGPAPMSCVVTGGGTNTNITHTPPRTAGQVMTAPVTSTQQFWLRCTATLPGGSLQFERTTTVDVLPLIQET